MSLISVPISFGELLDKISILEIKAERISDPAKRANVEHELRLLEETWRAAPEAKVELDAQRAALRAVNLKLWDIEDDIRSKERAQAFDEEFVRLARAVYHENDERARIKREINVALGSALVEEKSYADYRVTKS